MLTQKFSPAKEKGLIYININNLALSLSQTRQHGKMPQKKYLQYTFRLLSVWFTYLINNYKSKDLNFILFMINFDTAMIFMIN